VLDPSPLDPAFRWLLLIWSCLVVAWEGSHREVLALVQPTEVHWEGASQLVGFSGGELSHCPCCHVEYPFSLPPVQFEPKSRVC